MNRFTKWFRRDRAFIERELRLILADQDSLIRQGILRVARSAAKDAMGEILEAAHEHGQAAVAKYLREVDVNKIVDRAAELVSRETLAEKDVKTP